MADLSYMLGQLTVYEPAGGRIAYAMEGPVLHGVIHELTMRCWGFQLKYSPEPEHGGFAAVVLPNGIDGVPFTASGDTPAEALLAALLAALRAGVVT